MSARDGAYEDAIRDVERMRALLGDVGASGVEFSDPRVGYVTVQINRATWNKIQNELPVARPAGTTEGV